MKLIDKKEISKAKSLERAIEIQEGSKLAKKVDSLRELSAKEQANLIKFRNESVRKVKLEIDKVIIDRDNIENEIKELEDKKKKLQIPLDKEWKKIEQKQAELTVFAQELNEKHIFFEQTKKDFDVDCQHLEEEKQRMDEEHKRSIDNLAESEEKKEKATRILTKTEEIEKETLKVIEEKKQELKTRESNIVYAEKDIENKNKNIEKEYQFISEEKIRLADQRKTLERAMSRITKK